MNSTYEFILKEGSKFQSEDEFFLIKTKC